MTFGGESMPKETATFLANRPFIFCIQFNVEQTNLFFGAIK